MQRSQSVPKTIILIHGRNFKPNRAELERLWLEALKAGISRDAAGTLPLLEAATKSFAYYGDVSNAFLRSNGDKYDEAADIQDRRKMLARLKRYQKSDFNKKTYNDLPGKSSWEEALADAFANALSFVGLSDPVIERVAPDLREYWNDDSDFATNVRFPLIAPLKEAMIRRDEILLISHSLGTMIAYDTLWKFCRTGEYRPCFTDQKISLWITLGCPLSDDTVRRHLKGAAASGERRYPNNIVDWVNVAAEDDYISHDQVLADDYAEMKRLKLLKSIRDERIYNLAVRDGASNPHNELGYLIHPTVVARVAKWLEA